MLPIKKTLMSLSAAGLIALTAHENFADKPYLDLAGKWTNGFGNTHNVSPNKKVTVPQALEQLASNTQSAQAAVNRCINKPMTQGQFDAFVDFTFNAGGGAFCKSTMVRKFNYGDITGACNELRKWVYVNGKVVSGLVTRREAERKLCLGLT